MLYSSIHMVTVSVKGLTGTNSAPLSRPPPNFLLQFVPSPSLSRPFTLLSHNPSPSPESLVDLWYVIIMTLWLRRIDMHGQCNVISVPAGGDSISCRVVNLIELHRGCFYLTKLQRCAITIFVWKYQKCLLAVKQCSALRHTTAKSRKTISADQQAKILTHGRVLLSQTNDTERVSK